VLFAGQLGRFVVGHSGHNCHNIMKKLFFSFAGPNQAPLPLFNAMSAYLYFEIFGKLTSMAVTTLPGRLDRFIIFGRVLISDG
jgi:hypothetical protein